MTTVAIIGADGAGKTTIAQELQKSFPLPVKNIYMGVNIESSNYALPTSRLILWLKLRSYKRVAKRRNITDPKFISTHHVEHRSVKYGQIGATLRLVNRTAEGWYRQFVAWYYQLRGFIVIYDRHFLFDVTSSNNLADRIHYWLLNNLYPQPGLIIFLDAPPEILFSRKGEGTLEYLQRRRKAFLDRGEGMANFVCVDATRPFDQVYSDVSSLISEFYSTNTPRMIPDKGLESNSDV